MGDWRLTFLNRDRVRKVTADDIQRVAKYYFKADTRTVGLFIPTAQPDRTDIPAAPDLAAMLKDYKGDAAVASGEAFDPSPDNIDRRTQRLNLGGALKLAMIPKGTRGSVVFSNLRLELGDEKRLMCFSSVG